VKLQEIRSEELYWLCPSPFIVTYRKGDYVKEDDMRQTYNTHITFEIWTNGKSRKAARKIVGYEIYWIYLDRERIKWQVPLS